MSFTDLTSAQFIELLASKSAVPGGGGASALVGAVGAALGNMVGSLTVGKKKYAEVEPEIKALMAKCSKLQTELLCCIDMDAEAFEPLSKAYGIPKDDPSRAEIMENALKLACSVPLDIMRLCSEGIECCKEFAEKGSVIALSDAGTGAYFCKAAMMAASLNIFINTKSMSDKLYSAEIEAEADNLIKKYGALADTVCDGVLSRLRG